LMPPRCLRSALSPLCTQQGALKLTQPELVLLRLPGK